MLKSRCFVSILLVSTFLFSTACSNNSNDNSSSGSNSSSSNTSSSSSSSSGSAEEVQPSITSSDSIFIDENTLLSHTIEASGIGNLRYRLLEGEDNSLFTLDEDSGVLQTTETLNYESPRDENADNVYQLSVAVTNSSNQVAIQDLMVQVVDADDITIDIIFPLDGANVGGSAENITVRGSFSENGEASIETPSNTSIRVNGVTANLLESKPGEWMVEIPVESEQLSVSAEVFVNDLLVTADSINISNVYIQDNRTLETFGGDKLYGFSAGYSAILEIDRGSDETKALLELDAFREDYNCFRFNTLDISPNGERLIFSCIEEDRSRHRFIYEVASSQLQLLPENTDRTSTLWLNDRYVITSYAETTFIIRDAELLSDRLVTVEISSSLNYDICSSAKIFFNERVANLTLYSGTCRAEFISVDLRPFLEGTDSEATITADIIETNVDIEIRQVLVGDTLYDIVGSNLVSENLFTGETSTTALIKSGDFQAPWLDSGLKAPRIVAQANNTLYAKMIPGGDFFEIDPSNLSVTAHYLSDIGIKGYVDIQLKPDDSELAVYDPDYLQLSVIDMNNFSYKQVHDFTGFEEVTPFTDCRIDYDWDNGILYRNRVFDWGGIEATEDAHITAINVRERTQTNIIDGLQLAEILGETGTYRMGDVRLTSTPDQIIFSVLNRGAYPDYDPETGSETSNPLNTTKVISYNISSKEYQILHQLDESDWTDFSVGSDELRLSDFSAELNAVSGTAWYSGLLTLISLDGGTNRIIEPLSPYHVSLDSEIDAENRRVFMSGYYPSAQVEIPSLTSPDFDSMEIIEVNLDTGERKVIASKDKGNGIPMRWSRMQYDNSRDLLIDFDFEHISVMDPNSGDRVLMQISNDQ